MNISLKINKLANHYFFISSLSLWHPSCRPAYNKYWQQFFNLTEADNIALKKFAEIHQKYPFGKSFYLGRSFYCEDNPWSTIQTHTDHYKEIRAIFDQFEPYFEIIWKKEHPKLKKMAGKIKKYWQDNPDIIEKITKSLLIFYDLPKPKTVDINIILLLSSPDMTGGGANIDPYGITAEVSSFTGPIEKIMAILFHEITHLCFENYVMLGTPSPNIPSKIRETIITSFFPKGYLAENYFHITPSSPFTELAKKYIENKQKLDRAFINKLS